MSAQLAAWSSEEDGEESPNSRQKQSEQKKKKRCWQAAQPTPNESNGGARRASKEGKEKHTTMDHGRPAKRAHTPRHGWRPSHGSRQARARRSTRTGQRREKEGRRGAHNQGTLQRYSIHKHQERRAPEVWIDDDWWARPPMSAPSPDRRAGPGTLRGRLRCGTIQAAPQPDAARLGGGRELGGGWAPCHGEGETPR